MGRPTKLEFGTKAAADEIREQYHEHLCSDDDKRTKTVTFASDTPDGVLEQAEAAAISSQEEANRPPIEAVELTDAERRKLDFTRDGVNVPKARYLKGLGEEYNVDAFQHVDLAEIDTVADARPILDRARKSSGTGRGGGANYDDEATERERRTRRSGAEAAADAECDNARDYCEEGDEGACEYLVEACGYDREEAEQLVGMVEMEPTADSEQTELVSVGGTGFPEMEVRPAEAGALSRSWQGYKGAISDLDAALDTVTEAVTQARRAFQAINAIRRQHDQPDLEPDRLNDLLAKADAIPASIPEPTRLDSFEDSDSSSSAADQEPGDGNDSEDPSEESVDRSAVIETDDQRTLGGGRSNPQATLAGGEQGEAGQGEVEQAATIEQNPGGLMADEREATGPDPEDSEQGNLSTVGVSEGLRDVDQLALGSHSIADLQDAIDYLSEQVDGYGDRVEYDADLKRALQADGLNPALWGERQSQDLFRYGIDADDLLDRLKDDANLPDSTIEDVADVIIQFAWEDANE